MISVLRAVRFKSKPKAIQRAGLPLTRFDDGQTGRRNAISFERAKLHHFRQVGASANGNW